MMYLPSILSLELLGYVQGATDFVSGIYII